MGITCAESQANFAWFDLPVPDGEEAADVEAGVVRGLAERGVIVRAGGALGKPGALRVTYGTPEQNRRFVGGPARARLAAERSTNASRSTPAAGDQSRPGARVNPARA